MKRLLVLLLLAGFGCTEPNLQVDEVYKTAHDKAIFEQQFFIKHQQPLIENLFDSLLEALSDNEETKTVLAHFMMLQQAIEEYTHTNHPYFFCYANTELTVDYIIDGRTANHEIATELLLSHVEIEAAIEENFYPAAITYVKMLREKISAGMDIVLSNVLEYAAVMDVPL